MRRLAACIIALGACGSNPAPPAAPTQAPATGVRPVDSSPSLAPLAAVLAELEDVRPFIVVENGTIQCDRYTAEASAVVVNLDAAADQATAARRDARPADVERWQRAHTARIESLIAEIATPTRSAVHCEPMTRDQTWNRVKRALVAIAEPLTPPDAVAQRAALLAELLAAVDRIHSKADCEAVLEQLMAKRAGLEHAFEAMTPIEKFIDDHVWEEDAEQAVTSHPQYGTLSKFCPL